VARQYHWRGSTSCSLGLHLVILWAALLALTLEMRPARTLTSKLCLSNMVIFLNPRGTVLHHRTDRQNDHIKPLETLFAIYFAVRIPPPNYRNTHFIFLRIHDVLPHGRNTISLYQKATLRMPDLSRLRAFGCPIYTLSARTP
jgi:hypothetical protein